MTNPNFEAYGETMRWIENPEACGLRLVGLAHEVAPANYAYLHNAVDHRGWYIDDMEHETVSGVVYQLPGKNGVARYMVGYADPWNDGPACLAMRAIIGDKKECDWDFDPALRDAARDADGIAEEMAQKEREYQAAWRAGCDAREKARLAMGVMRDWKDAMLAVRAYCETGENDETVLHVLRRVVKEKCQIMEDARANFYSAINADDFGNVGFREGYENS